MIEVVSVCCIDPYERRTTGPRRPRRSVGARKRLCRIGEGVHRQGSRPGRPPEPGDVSLTLHAETADDVEYAELVNESEETIDIVGSTLRYDTGESYEFEAWAYSDGLTPGAIVRLTNTDAEFFTQPRGPPIHLHGTGIDGPIIEPGREATLTGPDGTVIAETAT